MVREGIWWTGELLAVHDDTVVGTDLIAADEAKLSSRGWLRLPIQKNGVADIFRQLIIPRSIHKEILSGIFDEEGYSIVFFAEGP
jgi:hypothetical protein